MMSISMRTSLQSIVSGPVHMAAEAAAVVRRGLWNSASNKLPFAVAECRTEQDVSNAICFAADQGLKVSVFGGGNDSAGRSAIDYGVVLDLRTMSSVTFDTNNSTVTLGGGARVLDLIRSLPADRVAATGDVSTVGVAALTLGGGYSKLLSRFGLSLDNLKNLRVVLANGTIVTVDDRQETELFWGLRGGGGNFGAVTSLTLAVHKVPAVLSAVIFIPLATARAGLLAVQRLLDEAPDALSISSAIGTLQAGDRGLLLWPLWSGEGISGERYFDQLALLAGACVLVRKWSSYADSFNLEAEKAWGKGRCYSVNARSLLRMDEEAVDVLLECARSRPTHGSWILAHDFRGAASRVAPEVTAFPLRRDHFNINIVSGWDVGGTSKPHTEWVENTSERLSSIALPGGYVALLGPDDKQRRQDSYGDAVPRLSAVKARVDPSNLFCSNVGQLQSSTAAAT